MPNVKIISDKYCSGCGLCSTICPNGSISMVISKEGFYRPKINEDKCVDCGLCYNQCKLSKNNNGNKSLIFYSAQSKDAKKLLVSTSGGFFQEIGHHYFKLGYGIFGVKYDGSMNVVNARALSIDDIVLMSGSKYVQSNSRDSYKIVMEDIISGGCVIYSGTPCQISALRTYLKYHNISDEKLYTVDFPCYGVPPVSFFKYTVANLESKIKGKITDFRFRDKKKNGFSHTTEITYNQAGYIKKLTIDDYRKIPFHFAFGQRNIFQQNCYHCEFINKKRVSDITIGSFWGIEKYTDLYDVKRGVSMICLNTQKGIEIFEEIKDKFIYKIQTEKETYSSNSGLYKAVPISNRENVFKCFTTKGIKRTIKKYYTFNIWFTIKYQFKRIFRKIKKISI